MAASAIVVYAIFSGLVSTISRGAIGVVADLPCVNQIYLYIMLLVGNGIVVALAPFCFNYAAYIAFGVLFGFGTGRNLRLDLVLGLHYMYTCKVLQMF